MKICTLEATLIALSLPLLLLADVAPDAPLGLTLAREAAAYHVSAHPDADVLCRRGATDDRASRHDHDRGGRDFGGRRVDGRGHFCGGGTAAGSRATAGRDGAAAGGGRATAGSGGPAASAGRRVAADRHRRTGAARRMRRGGQGRRRVLPLRHHLLPRGIPGQQPRLGHRGAAVIRREEHRMNKVSIRAALGVAVLTALASLPQGAHARDPGINQPGAAGNRGVAGPGVGAPGVGARDPHESAGRGGQSRRGRAGGGCARRRCPRPRASTSRARWATGASLRARRGRARRRRGGSWAQPQPGVAGNVGGVARRSVRP